ncbi:MAG: hypothetical protein H7836_13270 [Magnetococcus sp. YQC-3]
MVKKIPLEVNGFTGGLNTERSVVNVAASELMDGSVNVEIFNDGSIAPRRGIDFVGSSSSLTTVATPVVANQEAQHSPSVMFHRFLTTSGTTVPRVIVAYNNTFRVYESTTAAMAAYSTPLQTITLGTHVALNNKWSHIQMCKGDNKIFFAAPHMQHGYLSLNADGSTIDITYLEAWWRDLENEKGKCTRVKHTLAGVDSYFECVEDHTSAAADEPDVGANWTRYWRRLTFTPATIPSAWASSASYYSNFYKNFLITETVGTDTARPQAIAWFSGRLWVAFNNKLFYSRSVTKVEDLYIFTTDADPYDADDNEPVADDGGFLFVESRVLQLLPYKNSLLVSCKENVSCVNGRNGVFKHTDWTRSVVIRDAILGVSCMSSADSNAYVLSEGSIWKTEGYDDLGAVQMRPIGEDVIKSLYVNIPRANKAAARLLYSPGDSKMYMFFSKDVTTFDNGFQNSEGVPGYFTHCLIFRTLENLYLQDPTALDDRVVKHSFYLYEFYDGASDQQPYITYPFVMPPTEISYLNVVDGSGNQVVDGSGNNVVVESTSGSSEDASAIYFLVMQYEVASAISWNVKSCFGKFKSANIKDFSGSAYERSPTVTAITGVQTAGNIMARKGSTTIEVTQQQLTAGTGSLFMRTAWDNHEFAEAGSSTQVSGQRQLYTETKAVASSTIALVPGTAFTSKALIRGGGKYMQVIFQGEAGKDFKIFGWAQNLSGKEG